MLCLVHPGKQQSVRGAEEDPPPPFKAMPFSLTWGWTEVLPGRAGVKQDGGSGVESLEKQVTRWLSKQP